MTAAQGTAHIRTITIQARKRGYIHRPIAVWVNRQLIDEHGQIIENVQDWMLNAPPHMVVTIETPWLLDEMVKSSSIQIRMCDSRPDNDQASIAKPRIVSFGRKPIDGKRRQGQHVVLDVERLLSSVQKSRELTDGTFPSLLRIGSDVRKFCQENDLPIKVTGSGLASSLATDARFAPSGQYQVPRATNEAVRRWLPGVRHTSHTTVRKVFRRATSLDQRRAYHRGAQRIPLPSPQYLYARGYYASYDERVDKVWLKESDAGYAAALQQHGLFILRATQSVKPSEFAPRCCHTTYKDDAGYGAQVAVWSNELPFAIECGLVPDAIYAAWTSPEADTVLPAYAKWAEATIDAAPPERAKWLKPTLHSRYGLLGARPRRLFMASKIGKGKPTVWHFGLRAVSMQETELPAITPRTANAVAFGMLQSETETETLSTAYMLDKMGYTVLHTHADGIHIRDEQVPLLGPNWTATPMTNLAYEDEVSWTSNERDVLPGRDVSRRKEAIRRAAKRKRAWDPGESPEPKGMFRN